MSDIDYNFLVEFREHLFKQKTNRGGYAKPSYVKSLFTILRKYVKEARKQKWIKDDPFYGFSISVPAKINQVLTEDEVQLWEDFTPPENKKHLVKAKEYYLFLIYTGMRYKDMFDISESNVENGEMIKYLAQKTKKSKGKHGRVPLHLFEYKALQLLEVHNFDFKRYHNNSFNNAIRDIAKLIGLDKYLTVHSARHSFKSIMLERGYPLHIIAEWMAHSSTTTTAQYGSISDKAVLKKL